MTSNVFTTHDVFNQSAPLADYNLFESNSALKDALAFNLPPGRVQAACDRLSAIGAELGNAETLALGDAANRNPPQLKSYDRFGNRRDEVEFHPAWHQLLRLAVRYGLHSGPWADAAAGAHVERAAAYLMFSEVETGVLCPVTMTYGAVPALQGEHDIAAAWLPRLYSRDYDPRFIPMPQKRSALIGMGMTEKQGGSDVRANTTRALRVAGREYVLVGHKWFFSAPMCDAFLVLAQAPGGLSCFFLPRFTADGALNAIRIQRLKDKLGNRSNASSEVEFHEARATLLGEEGRGVQTILQMGVYTRLDCALGTAGLMRRALAQALSHAAQRSAFGKLLQDQPLMRNVLADLTLESEAATALGLRLARAYDAQADEAEHALRRVLTPAAKFWICKRGAHFAQEAMEVLGGNGYVEESALPRIYREMPLNSIWEGAGNVMCLDVLRALRKASTVDALVAELDSVQGSYPEYDRFCAQLKQQLTQPDPSESAARRLAQDIALAVQASLLARHAPLAFETFAQSRLGGAPSGAFGMLPAGAPFERLIERALPA